MLRGSFQVYLCKIDETKYEVIYEDGDVWGWDWSSCTPEMDAADWDCLVAKAAENFDDQIMPVIIDLWGDNGDCDDEGSNGGGDTDDGYETWTSIYVKQLCVIPCYTPWPTPSVSFVNCGESTACCEQKTFWCRNQEGEYDQTEQYPEQTGVCSEGSPKGCLEVPGQEWVNCKPRFCTHSN